MTECKYEPGREWLKTLVTTVVGGLVVVAGVYVEGHLRASETQTVIQLERRVEWVSNEQLNIALTVRNVGNVEARGVTVDVKSSRLLLYGPTVEPMRRREEFGHIAKSDYEFSPPKFSMNPGFAERVTIEFGVENQGENTEEDARAFVESEAYDASCANCPSIYLKPTPEVVGVPTPTPTYTPTPTPTLTPTATATPTATPTWTATPPETPTPAETPQPPLWIRSEGCLNPNATISSIRPEPSWLPWIGNKLDIIGTANIDGFQFYKVELGLGLSPGTWVYLGGGQERVVNGVLITLDTTNMLEGTFSLRLVVVDNRGNYPDPCQVTFRSPLEIPVSPWPTPLPMDIPIEEMWGD